MIEEMKTGGLEGLAKYLNQQNTSLRNEILEALGMDTTQRVDIYTDEHRVLNGNGVDTYSGTRWVGRTQNGDSIHEVHQELASNSKYEGIAEETGTRIFPEDRKFLKENPKEKLAVIKTGL